MPTVPKQIISRLYGGLGNQMFQYAAGRALALDHDCQLHLDLRYFGGDVPFGFGLDAFQANFRKADLHSLPPSKKSNPVGYALWRGLRRSPRLFRESGLSYNREIASVAPGAYLQGYWQSEQYFERHAETIRGDFRLKEPPNTENAALLKQIAGTNAVSLHVRRGDYVSNPKANKTHGLCSPGYYRNAVEKIAALTQSDLRLFVFSDDPDWAESNLEFEHEMTIVRINNAETASRDMHLMSACNHHIIANSSFSWWGAWLDPKPEKIVIAPTTWFAHPKMKNPDICPQDWVRL